MRTTTAARRKRRTMFDFIRDAAAVGYPPSVREIAQAAGVSVSTAHYHLTIMEREGVILPAEGKGRSWRVP